MGSHHLSEALGRSHLSAVVERRFPHVAEEAFRDAARAEVEVSARLIDGRAVHFYLHLVEPSLGARVSLDTDHRIGIRSSLLELIRNSQAGDIVEAGRTEPGPYVPIEFREEFQSALSTLEAVGLGYFSQLAVCLAGVQLDAHEGLTNRIDLFVVRTLQPASGDLAQALLRSSAELYMGQCVVAETGAPDKAVSSVFGSLVVTEYWRRVESPREVETDLLISAVELMDSERTSVLARELLACWFPGWRRGAFIVNSPLDLVEGFQDIA